MMTARSYIERVFAAIERSEQRREHQRLNQPEPTPIETLTTEQAPSSPPRDDAPATPVRRNHHSGET